MKKILLFIAPALFVGGSYGQSVFTANGTGRTGSVQEYVVPQCVTEISIEAFGAQGGNTNGGLGARMKGHFPVTFGDTIFIVVGQQGVINNCGGPNASAGGGGGSFVWKNSGVNRTLLLVAGGGGGGNMNWSDPNCMLGIDADTLPDGTQGNGSMSAMGGTAGNGGFGNAPSGTGSGGAGWLTNGQNSSYGTGCTGGDTYPLFTGGFGSSSFSPGGDGGYGGGGGAVCGNGGGGGYSGGGGGEGSSCRAGGGGGGSYNVGTNQSNSRGTQTGDGEVIIDITAQGPVLSVSVTPSDTVCEGTAVTLTGTGADIYTWDNAVINGVPFDAVASAVYTLVGQDSSGVCSDTISVSLVVNPAPTLTLSNGGFDTLCVDVPAVMLTATPNGGTFSGNGVSGNIFDPASANMGWNTITYAYTDINGCSNTISDSIYVRTCLGMNAPGMEIPVTVFPNPVSENVTVNTAIVADQVLLYDVSGKLLYTAKPVSPVHTIDMKGYRAGIYLLEVRSGMLSSKVKLVRE